VATVEVNNAGATMLVDLNGVLDRIEARLSKIDTKIDNIQENVAKLEERMKFYTDKIINTEKNISEIQKTISEVQIQHESERILSQNEDRKRDKLRTLFMFFTSIAAISSLIISLIKL
jgi:predicted  nucleic acid-binding Zn-ribbon protein